MSPVNHSAMEYHLQGVEASIPSLTRLLKALKDIRIDFHAVYKCAVSPLWKVLPASRIAIPTVRNSHIADPLEHHSTTLQLFHSNLHTQTPPYSSTCPPTSTQIHVLDTISNHYSLATTSVPERRLPLSNIPTYPKRVFA